MMKECKKYIDLLTSYLLDKIPNGPEINNAKKHIMECDHCKNHLNTFSNIVDHYLIESKLEAAISCSDVSKAMTSFHKINQDNDLQENIINHLLICKKCRNKFISVFVANIENSSSNLDYIKNIPNMNSPIILLELKKEKESEVKEAIKMAEASIIKIKPDGGMKLDLRDIIEKKIESLPPYPDNVKVIIELIDEDADLKDIAGEICKDVSLTARILQIANSAYYRGKFPVEDIQRALSRVGLKSISRLIKVFGIHTILINQAGNYLEGYDMPMKIFLNYSTMVAIISMLLAPKYDAKMVKNHELSFEIDMVAYTAGLVENIGMLILDHCIDKLIRNKIKTLINDGMEITSIEDSLFGITHPQISGQLLKKWNLSDSFINSVILHHSSGDGKRNDYLSNILYSADTIASIFLRPTSKIRPFLNVIDSDEEFLDHLPFNYFSELESFYSKELIPAFEANSIQYNKNLYI